jgi:uncharacterized protein YegL
MAELPGGPMAKRPVHFFFLVDCSVSMSGEKISSLNSAIQQALPAMVETAKNYPKAAVMIRALKFANGAQWINSTAVPLESYSWTSLTVDKEGGTAMGRAMEVLADELKIPPMPERALPPVIVLVSDGQPTDDFGSGLKKISKEQWFRHSIKVAIGIGDDCEDSTLEKFIGNPEMKVLRAYNSDQLADRMKWATTIPLKAATAPSSQPGSIAGTPKLTMVQPGQTAKPADSVW